MTSASRFSSPSGKWSVPSDRLTDFPASPDSAMNNTLTRTGARMLLFTLTFSLVACSSESDNTAKQGQQSERLAPCAADGSIFADLPFNEWQDAYHGRVQEVVEAHMETLNETTTLPLQCTADDYSQLVPASQALRRVASELPAYSNSLGNLSEVDMAPVLLEFLRVYECSMKQREEYLSIYVPREFSRTETMSLGDFFEEKARQKKIMDEEMRVSRPALERTLGLISGYDRLRPLALDIECIKRASLDLRNVLGLASDASSCLPRIWDTHGSLRDLKE